MHVYSASYTIQAIYQKKNIQFKHSTRSSQSKSSITSHSFIHVDPLNINTSKTPSKITPSFKNYKNKIKNPIIASKLNFPTYNLNQFYLTSQHSKSFEVSVQKHNVYIYVYNY